MAWQQQLKYGATILIALSVAQAWSQGKNQRLDFSFQSQLLKSAWGTIGDGQKPSVATPGNVSPTNAPIVIDRNKWNDRDKGCTKKPETETEGFTEGAMASLLFDVQTEKPLTQADVNRILGAEPFCTLPMNNATLPGITRVVYLPAFHSNSRLIIHFNTKGMVENYEFTAPN